MNRSSNAVVHITETHEATAGGIPEVVTQLARHVSDEFDVQIVCTGRNPVPAPPGVELEQVRPWRIGSAWSWSPGLARMMESLARRDHPPLFHLHGAWGAPQWYAAKVGVRYRAPVVLTLHGQLEPYHWSDRGLLQFAKKQLYWRLLARQAFRPVAVVHAITEQEKKNLSKLLPGQRIEIIPNAADLEEVDRCLGPAAFPLDTGRRPVIGFFGRFHPKKGVDLLIEAFRRAQLPREWTLALGGPDGSASYMARLRGLAAAPDIRGRVSFVGPLYGGAKWQFFRSIAVLALPSRSEVMGLVNLEASACGTPTITTKETGLEDWGDGGGVLITPDIDAIAESLVTICSADSEAYRARAAASRLLIERRYSWAVVAPQWKRLYGSLAAAQSGRS